MSLALGYLLDKRGRSFAKTTVPQMQILLDFTTRTQGPVRDFMVESLNGNLLKHQGSADSHYESCNQSVVHNRTSRDIVRLG